MTVPRIIQTDMLGEPAFDSPLQGESLRFQQGEAIACSDRARDLSTLSSIEEIAYYELAGPREKVFFNPSEVTVGIVTCGGLCPGLNDVIRALTFCSLESYGAKRVLGFQYGYEGLVMKHGHQPIELNTDNTDDIHERGGTILKSSRGEQSTEEIIETLIHYDVNILFTIGGDGTQRGARDIAEEVKARNLPISIVGIPKTIDNDIDLIERSFGYETAVEAAWEIITQAHAEASAFRNGVGIVRLMGRQSGWIAASAVLANSNVNFCLVPEVHFDLHGEGAFLSSLKERLQKKEHAVVVIAEGAGQHLFKDSADSDRSGNRKLADIGILLKEEIQTYFKDEQMACSIKYFDPSYSIRSRPANANDSMYCLRLGYSAVHAAMAGKTNMIIGLHHSQFVHLPIPLIGKRKQIDPASWFWQTVLQATGQPTRMCKA